MKIKNVLFALVLVLFLNSYANSSEKIDELLDSLKEQIRETSEFPKLHYGEAQSKFLAGSLTIVEMPVYGKVEYSIEFGEGVSLVESFVWADEMAGLPKHGNSSVSFRKHGDGDASFRSFGMYLAPTNYR